MADQNIEAIYPLSPVQEGILYHTLSSSRAGEYFEQYTCTFNVALDIDRFELAWQTVVARHPALRSLFAWEKQDRPLQLVRKRVSLPWDFETWTGISDSEIEQRWSELVRDQRAKGFDLAQAPLMRFTLVRLGDERYRFLWSFHHALVDGWSLRLVLDEIAECYVQPVFDGSPSKAGKLTFENFIARLSGFEIAARAYWSGVLSGFASPTSPIPRATSLYTTDDASSGVKSFVLQPEIVIGLEAFARRERLTLNTLILGAWAILLGRYASANDVVFGTTVSGRSMDLPGLDSVVGMFINTLPLRVHILPDRPLNEWLHEIQSQQVEMRNYEHSSLVDVRRCSDVAPGAALFDSIIVFQNVPPLRAISARQQLQVSDENYMEYSHYPLALLVFPGEHIELVTVYKQNQFDSATVDAIQSQLQHVLQTFIASPDQRIGAVPIFPEAYRDRVLRDWNNTVVELPTDRCVHEIIAAQAITSPNSIAIESDRERVTYKELMDRVSLIASYLTERGIGKGTCVPVFAERNANAIVAMLAVLRVGAAYVPMDTTHPRDRSAYVFDDLRNYSHSAVASDRLQLLILTESHLAEKLPSGALETVCVDEIVAASGAASGAMECVKGVQVAADHLAYVIYTSGSTGQPKGVMVEHASLVNSTLARFEYYPEKLAGFLMLSSFAADSSIAGIYWTLCSGGTLVLPPARIEQDIPGLSALVRKHEISHLLCSPSLYVTVLEHADVADFRSLQCVIVAGEQCVNEVVHQHFRMFAATRLYNEYGPTEATVWATVASLKPIDAENRVTVGRPVANTSIYILDQAMRPVPIGIVGEIYIGGAGLARGYLNDDVKTADRFVANPIADSRDQRLYKTGDRGCFHTDGNIEFLGRVDNQIKIRGFRIEPQEIEVALCGHALVHDAVVVMEDDGAVEEGGGTEMSFEPAALDAALKSLEPLEADALLTEVENLSPVEMKRQLHLLERELQGRNRTLGRSIGI